MATQTNTNKLEELHNLNIGATSTNSTEKLIELYSVKIQAAEVYIDLYGDYVKSSSDRLEKKTPLGERIPIELYNEYRNWCEKVEVLRAEQKAYKEFKKLLENLLQ